MDEPAQPTWFDDLLQRHYRPLTAFSCGLLGDLQAANDVVQDVFVAAWRATQQHKPPFTPMVDEAGAKRWLYRVAYRRAISMRRHTSVLAWESLEQAEASELSDPAQTAFVDRVVEGEALGAALARLTPEDAACVLLHVVHGFKLLSVAQILEISLPAAKKRVARATQRLRAAYFASDEVPVGKRGAHEH
jgi:RNA polymerase sigma-70 factor (ECF subfamily)